MWKKPAFTEGSGEQGEVISHPTKVLNWIEMFVFSLLALKLLRETLTMASGWACFLVGVFSIHSGVARPLC